MRPFHIDVPQSVLDDLHERLRRTRFAEPTPLEPWAGGVPPSYLRELVAFWRDEFDWRAVEAWLNTHPQFIADVGGTDIHFVHRRAARDDAPAILIMHGWPHTFDAQLAFADMLTDFHVVVASLPGFAFSPAYRDRPVDNATLADTMHSLMVDTLGYSRYITYGEDVSATVSDRIAALHPDHVAGIVATHARFPSQAQREALGDEGAAYFAHIGEVWEGGTAYSHLQHTRPDTLAAALIDSPAGLAAWIVEKFSEWSDGDHPEDRFTKTQLLTTVMIFWITRSIATSFRPYFEHDDTTAEFARIEVPAWIRIQRHELGYPRSLADSGYADIRSFGEMSSGGHFTAAEAPRELAGEVRAFAEVLGLL